jgi:hypothetical protein
MEKGHVEAREADVISVSTGEYITDGHTYWDVYRGDGKQ